MRRVPIKKLLILGALIALSLSLPLVMINPLRQAMISLCFPIWKCTQKLPFGTKEKMSHWEKACKRLEAENHLLGQEVVKLRSFLEQQIARSIAEEAKIYQDKGWNRRAGETKILQQKFQKAVPAAVIYRDPLSWSSSCWIDVGEETNERMNHPVIQKNSPVVVGRAVVGVVDEVRRKHSRIRLLTDSALKPSVRVARGHPQNVYLIEQIDNLLKHFKNRKDLPLTTEQKQLLFTHLENLQNTLQLSHPGRYLAKGVLQGTGKPLWRGGGHTLKGWGFNYDFPDDEGPARDLQTGLPLNTHATAESIPLIQKGDLLVTTGFDGVFPAGLWVAEVSYVTPLREGAYAFDIEAMPIVSGLNELQSVFILPPSDFEEPK